jgi:hypothetical protein
MKVSQLAAIALRLYGLFLLIGCVDSGENMLMWAFWPPRLAEAPDKFFAFSSAFNLVLCGFIGLFLVVRTDLAAKWVLRGVVDSGELGVSNPGELAVLTFTVAGLVFVVSGLEGVVGQAVAWLLSPVDTGTGTRPAMATFDKTHAAASLVRTAIGLWLFLGPRGVVQLARRARGLPTLSNHDATE